MEPRPKVLIVDDEKEICFLLARTLSHKGIESSYALSLTEAKKILKMTIPALIFLDNHLPDGLGIDFIEYINMHYPDTKVTIITAQELPIDVVNALARGAVDYITKPFTTEKIYSILEKVWE